MYKVFPVKSLAYVISLLTLGIFLLIELVTGAFEIEVRTLAIPGIVWLLLAGVTLNPIWRPLWRLSAKLPLVPDLNEAVYPDLNGVWNLTLDSNWSRQEQLIEAALDRKRAFDILKCDADQLAPLLQMKLRAEIKQSWWSIKMIVTNPKQDSPIKESNSYIAIPRMKTEQNRASLCYFYDQTNETDSLADDPVFCAAACLNFHSEDGSLQGTFWTARQWRRAINTAGKLTLTRSETA